VPFCWDVYVWVEPDRVASVLPRFVERYVNGADPGESRFGPFLRVFVTGGASREDAEALVDLRRVADSDSTAFSLYLAARDHYGAIVTITREGADEDPDAAKQAAALIDVLRREFDSPAGIAGVELSPPQSRAEWDAAELVALRSGRV
jgi:hypothetical protein